MHVAGTGALIGAAVLMLVVSKLRRRQPRITSIPKGQSLASTERYGFSVLSFNVLGDTYTSPRHLPHVAPSLVPWSYRWPLIEAEVFTSDADIICLQEVDLARLEDYHAAAAAHSYQILVQQGKGDHPVLNCILYSSKFTMVWSDHRSRTLIAAFTFEVDNFVQVLYVVNCHLEGHPHRPNDRVNQMRSALQRMQWHQGNNGIAPESANVLVCGDFNSTPHEGVCRLLHHGRLVGGYTESYLPSLEVTKTTIVQPYTLLDAYSQDDLLLPFTRKVPCSMHTIDYIWHSPQLVVDALYCPYRPRDLGLILQQSLPNRLYPSDHLPIGAVFHWHPYCLLP